MANVTSNILARVYILFAVLMVFGGLVAFRIIALQWNKEVWLQKEIAEKVTFRKIVADRGSILAEDGTILATSIPFYRIAMDVTMIDTTVTKDTAKNAPNHWRDSVLMLSKALALKFGPLRVIRDSVQLDTLERTAQRPLRAPQGPQRNQANLQAYRDSLQADSIVRHIIPINKDSLAYQQYYDRIMTAIATKDRHIYLCRRMIDFAELDTVKTFPLIRQGRKAGFIVEKIHNKRFYPFGDLASITLGRMQGDTVGIRGIESAFNRELRGRDGYALAQKIAGGYMPIDQYGEAESEDGLDIYTTLNVNFQEVTEKALREAVEKNEAKFGTVIVIETATGKIKALANYPETYNYAFARQVEPGSTFKLASALAMIEDRSIDACDTINTGNGVATYEDKKITDAHALGKATFEQIFAKSSNVGTSLAVHARYKDDPMRYIRHLERFGLTEPANRQMQGEPAPVVHRPGDESWTPVMLPSMSIGYSISITPLQMAAFYNAIANNGIYLRPYIVESIRDRSQVVRSYGPERREQPICTPSSVMAVKELMRAVVDYGTAKNIRSAKFNIAGKTGTARKAVNGEYRTIYQSSFAGFFPAEAPKYTIYVLIDEPSAGRIYGADVAAPVFRDIAESIWAMDWDLSRQPQRKDSIPDPRPAPRMMYARHAKAFYPSLGIASAGVPNEDWVRPSYNGHQIMYTPVCPEDKGTIPDVKGMSARDAIFLLENLGCRVRVVGRGRVVRQSLLPGYRVAEGGSNITVFLEE